MSAWAGGSAKHPLIESFLTRSMIALARYSPDHPLVRLPPVVGSSKSCRGSEPAEERAAVAVVVEGLYSQGVPGTEELPVPPVPDHKRKIPDDLLWALLAPAFVCPQDHLGIGIGSELDPFSL